MHVDDDYQLYAVFPIPIVAITVAIRYDYYGVKDSDGNLL